MMNNLLASSIGFFNGLLALIFIISGAAAAYSLPPYYHNSDPVLNALLGSAVGLIFAILVCGVLALFISMRNELILIRRILDKQALL